MIKLFYTKRGRAIGSIDEHISRIEGYKTSFVMTSDITAIASELSYYLAPGDDTPQHIKSLVFRGDTLTADTTEDMKWMAARQRNALLDYLRLAKRQIEIKGVYSPKKANYFDGMNNWKVITTLFAALSAGIAAGVLIGYNARELGMKDIFDHSNSKIDSTSTYVGPK